MESIMSTVRLHRVIRTTPERLYRALLDADAMVKWLPPHGFTGKVHHLEARVGGSYRMSFTNLSTGHSHASGEMTTTITLKQVSCGTELEVVQEGIPEVIPAEQCYLGWQESLSLLTLLVEADIPE
jgi:hypothetical protein